MRSLSPSARAAEDAEWAAALANEDGQWQQCATKMTRFGLRLVDRHDRPVHGSTLQPGGLELELTLQSVTGQTLTDAHNPKPNEGALAGSARGAFETKVRLMESRHSYRCHIMLLSSHIGGALMRIHVAPSRADLAAAKPGLCFTSRPFLSRARDPGPASARAATKRKAATEAALAADAVGAYLNDSPDYQDLSAFSEGEPLYRSAGCGFDDDDEDATEAEAEAPVPATSRIQNTEARTRLQGLLASLEGHQPLPSGPELVEALRMCRVGA